MSIFAFATVAAPLATDIFADDLYSVFSDCWKSEFGTRPGMHSVEYMRSYLASYDARSAELAALWAREDAELDAEIAREAASYEEWCERIAAREAEEAEEALFAYWDQLEAAALRRRAYA